MDIAGIYHNMITMHFKFISSQQTAEYQICAQAPQHWSIFGSLFAALGRFDPI